MEPAEDISVSVAKGASPRRGQFLNGRGRVLLPVDKDTKLHLFVSQNEMFSGKDYFHYRVSPPTVKINP